MARNGTNDTGSSVGGLARADIIGAVLALGWMVALGLLFWVSPPVVAPFDSMEFLLVLIAVFMPVGVIWVAVYAARSARAARMETFRLQQVVDKIRQSQLAERAARQAETPRVEQTATAPAPRVSDDTAQAPTRFASRREVSRLIVPQPAPQMPADQPSLSLDTTAFDERPPLARADMIRALHFPDDENDTEGFAALRRALRDRGARKLVQASQDVLTLLSQDGIYMDDLRTEPVGADIWRRFAQGERGAAVARLGTVRDGDTLDITTARMREDMVFRDAVHHFLRRFDQMLVIFEGQATDTDMLAMAETRTARAFVLLGRATGTFR